jgi:glycogen synthase
MFTSSSVKTYPLMRMAFVSYEYPPDTGKGGIGTYLHQLIQALQPNGWDVHLFVASHYRQGISTEYNATIHRVQCKDVQDFRAAVVPVFAAEHLQQPFMVIESAEINANAWEIKKQFPALPMVVRLHAPGHLVELLKKQYIPFWAKLRFVLGALRRGRLDAGYWRTYNKYTDEDYQFTRLADSFTAPSAAMQQWAVAHWGIQQREIAVIPNVFIPPAALLQIPIQQHTANPVVVFFGRLNPLKGLVNATLAIKQLLQQQPHCRFVVVGDDGNGPYAGTSMRSWMQQVLQPVLDKVSFRDGVPYEDLPGILHEATVVLLPSLFESYSYACAEAMAAGKAIVGSNTGGMEDLLQDGQSGLLVNPHSVPAIFNALQQLVTQQELRYRLAVAARQRIVSTQFGIGLTDQYTQLYNRLVAGA